jgi:hypothetical protein
MPKRTTGATRPKAAKEWTISLQPEHGPVTDAARRIFDPTAHIAHLVGTTSSSVRDRDANFVLVRRSEHGTDRNTHFPVRCDDC